MQVGTASYAVNDTGVRPLCVDLDGTLLKTDALHETLLLLLVRRPRLIFSLIPWLLRGKAHFKFRICEQVRLDASVLPYHESFLAWLRDEHRRGRELYLATASDQSIATGVAGHLGIFVAAWGSNGGTNLSGAHKKDLLVREFGDKGFDYAGNSKADLPVWKHAASALVVNAAPALVESAGRVTRVEQVFASDRITWTNILKGIRVRQWVKNVLIFVVILTSHHFADLRGWSLALTAFLTFGLCASAIYVVNDLVDLEADRRHSSKRNRPFASGVLPLWFGVLLVPILLVAALLCSLTLPLGARLTILTYTLLSVIYSFFLKRKMLVDVFMLGVFYTLRILAGAAATGIVCSSWLLGFSIFFFLSLGLAKRASELRNLEGRLGPTTKTRGYYLGDLKQLEMFGTASAFAAGIVLALYIHSSSVTEIYPHPEWLWIAIVAVVYWQCRVWLLAGRGVLNEDPVIFAVSDKLTYIIALIVCLSGFLATQNKIAVTFIAP